MRREDGRAAAGRRRVVVAAGLGTFVEVYDGVLYAVFAVFLAERFFPRQDPTAALLSTFAVFAVGFVVRPVGAIVWGHLGDRFGRRVTLSWSILLMTGATVALGLLPTYDDAGVLAPVLLLACRLLQGLSLSAELPGAQLLTMEHAPDGRRGRTVAVVIVAANLGNAAATTVALVLARVLTPDQLGDWGWRVAFLLAAVVGSVGFYIRARLTEGPAFAALGEEARRGPAPLGRAMRSAKRRMVLVTTWLAAFFAGGYVVAGYLPTYLIRTAGLSPGDAFAAVLLTNLAGSVAAVAGGFLVDRLPLRPLAAAAMAGVAVAAVPGFLLATEARSLAGVVAGQALWVVFLGASQPVGAVLGVASFPVEFRFTAVAVTLNVAITLFGSTAPYVCTWLVAATGDPVAPGYYVLAVACLGVVAALGLPRHSTGNTS